MVNMYNITNDIIKENNFKNLAGNSENDGTKSKGEKQEPRLTKRWAKTRDQKPEL